MATDPPAPDLGAIRARLMSYPRVTMYDDDVQALVAAFDAQAARLAALEQIIFTHEWHVSCCPVLLRALDDVLADDYEEEAP